MGGGPRGSVVSAPSVHRPVVWWAASLGLAGVLAIAAVAFDPGAFGRFYLPRVALLYPLILAVAILVIVSRRPWRAGWTFDLLDGLAAAFAAWQVLTAALSPAPVVAWFGYYNRGAGALFWIGLSLLFVAARRLLADEDGRRLLTWAASCVLAVAGVVALAQVLGAESFWGGAIVNGRVGGPTGNPVALAGLGLLGVYVAAGLPQWRRGATQFVALIGTAGAALCLVLSVSRAAYLAVGVGIVIVAVAWALQRRRRRLLVLAVVVVAGLAAAAAYGVATGSQTNLFSRLGGVGVGLTSSDSLRITLWHEAASAVSWRPLVGTGPGAFVLADRRYRPQERRVLRPWALASDPHSLPLLLASTSGVPGLLLAAGIAAVVLWAALRRRGPPEGEVGARAPRRPLPDHVTAGLAYLGAATAFLLVSPLDLVVAVPVVLVAALVCGAPLGEARLSRHWAPPARAGAAVAAVACGALGLALLISAAAGVQWWRADRAFASFAHAGSPAAATRAADLWPYEPFYALEAGAAIWRQGLAAKDTQAVARGRALVQTGVRRDPTGALGRADLARLAIAQGNLEAARVQLEEGLRWNPGHPVLEGLWGYAALVAQSQLQDKSLATRLVAGLEALPAASPDAWYWISRVRGAQGDASGAAQARARAKGLAPNLGSWRYRQRLLTGR